MTLVPLLQPTFLSPADTDYSSSSDGSLTQDTKLDEEPRSFSRAQAAKHAQDVYRVVAMMTMDERDRASEVVARIVETDAFRIAAQCWQNHFCENPLPVVLQLGANWQAADTATIREVLSEWFG